MRYCELGEARILKRYKSDELLKPVRRAVVQSSALDRWQPIEQAAARYIDGLKVPSVRIHS
jgi:hypothetical protein